MDAFNYFQAGFVRTIFSNRFGISKKLVLMKTKVNPSQRSPDNAQGAWIIVIEDGEILSAHCTCMAGLVFQFVVVVCHVLCLPLCEGCSHVAAIMFKVKCAVRLGNTSVTYQVCKWNDVFCNKVSRLSAVVVFS